MKVTALLFDFDGTLVRSSIDFATMKRSVLAVCNSFDVVIDDSASKLILEIVNEAVARLAPRVGVRLRAMAELCIRDIERAAAERAEAIPGVAQALADLHAEGRKIAIITRNCREVADIELERAPLPFDAMLTRDDVAEVKPKPDHAYAALAAVGASVEQAVLVGDYQADMQCAVAAGIAGVGVLTGASTEPDLRAAGALDVIDSVADLPRWLADRGW